MRKDGPPRPRLRSAAFAVASLLALLALVTLVVKHAIERRGDFAALRRGSRT